jgi:transposase
VIEVNRPSRQTRRRRGKSDPIDAEAAARAVQAGTATTVAKTADGQVEMIRTLRLVRRSALKARTQAANQLQSLVVTAPDQLREQLRRLSLDRLAATAAQLDRCAAGGCRRQPRAPAQRGRLRAPVRRRTDPSVLWQDDPASAAPGRQP